ncbi:MAG: hypothetical protein ACW99G_21055 [Candidatus Thorarchaeota archaeon]|jgi:hypothetical protein
MKRNVKIGLFVFATLVLLLIGAGNVLADREVESNCGGCHDNPNGITISMASSIDVEPGETFQLDVTASGLSQDVFVLRIPDDADDNSDFTVLIPNDSSNPGLVDDNDANDVDPATNAIQTSYSITAPAFTGQFTLTVFAAQHMPSGASSSITVNVIQVGGGPEIGEAQTTPDIPRADEDFTVTVPVTSNDTITYVILQYSTTNGTSWENVTMAESVGVYVGTIPGQANNQEVFWRIVAADGSGIEVVGATFSYITGQIPVEPIELPQLHYGWLLGAPALFFAYLGTALEYYDEERFTKVHGIMLSLAYILTTINVLALFMEPASAWTAMNPAYLINLGNTLLFVHSWHIWLGIISMILGTLAFITHLGGWKTCNLGLPAVLLWTILGIMGIYLGVVFVP